MNISTPLMGESSHPPALLPGPLQIGEVASTPGGGQIKSVQALRAIAALSVVVFHTTVLWHDRFGSAASPWQNGNSGVDLFFVISGFIMVLSSRRLVRRKGGWRRFMSLRIVRIGPMYWLATLAKLAAIVAAPKLILHTRPNGWNIIASFLFIPSYNAQREVMPVLPVGWTLSFEMLFYATFAAALACMVEPAVIVAPIMVSMAGLSLLHRPDWPAWTALASPLVLEFVFGMGLAHLFLARRLNVSRPLPFFILAALGLLALMLAPAVVPITTPSSIPDLGDWRRVMFWGTAACAALAGCLATERWLDPYLPRWLVVLGEASYSLYLTHGFVLPVVGALAARARLSPVALGIVLVPACIIGSVIVALIIYRWVEVPMTAWLRQKVRGQRVASFAAPQSPVWASITDGIGAATEGLRDNQSVAPEQNA